MENTSKLSGIELARSLAKNGEFAKYEELDGEYNLFIEKQEFVKEFDAFIKSHPYNPKSGITYYIAWGSYFNGRTCDPTFSNIGFIVTLTDLEDFHKMWHLINKLLNPTCVLMTREYRAEYERDEDYDPLREKAEYHIECFYGWLEG